MGAEMILIMESKGLYRRAPKIELMVTPPSPETRVTRSFSTNQSSMDCKTCGLPPINLTPETTPRSKFSQETISSDEEITACTSCEALELQVKMLEAELELSKEALTARKEMQGKYGEENRKELEDAAAHPRKSRDVMRVRSEMSFLKAFRDFHDSENLKHLTSLTDEIAKLKSELNVAKTFEKEAAKTDFLENELRKTTELLESARESIKLHLNTIESLIQRKVQLEQKIELLESEVESEKEHSAEIEMRLSENMKQLLASKTMCEADLTTLQEKHIRCLTDSSKVEENLRTELLLANEECKRLKAKLEIPPECTEISQQLMQVTKENDNLQCQIAVLEEKFKNISVQLVKERAQHFEVQNLLTLDIETLRTENEILKKTTEAEIRDFEDLRRQLESSELRLHGESCLLQRIDELSLTVKERDSELQKRLIEIEERKIYEREFERKIAQEELRCRKMVELEKTNDEKLIAELAQTKSEAERCIFEEIEKRAHAENQVYSLSKAVKLLESERNSLREQLKYIEHDLTRSMSRVDLSQHRSSHARQSSEMMAKERFSLRFDTQRSQPEEVEGENQAPEPPEVTSGTKSRKEKLANSQCDCTLF